MTNTERIVRTLLSQRGIEGEENIQEFLSPRPKIAHNPFLLHDMEAGVDLILSEINAGTRICIYGDYDADGITSVCILSTFLKQITDNIFYFIPSRFKDGYGLNNDALDQIRAQGAGLVITVDCGSVSYDEVEHAKSIGLKIMVTDHHTIDNVKADCIVINPKQKECHYPFEGLAGCGVAFKLAQALRMRLDLPKSSLNNCLDFVAIGTIGDVMPLVDENRTMVKYGLIKINQRARTSISALLEGLSMNHVLSENVSFGIVPHINASGRIGDASDAVELLISEDVYRAREMTHRLKFYNQERKQLQEEAFNNCIAMIPENENFPLIYREDIHEGIGGIVAGKIKENLNRPCIIVMPTEDGRLKGTGRSVDNIDLFQFLNEFSNLFDTFGGHKGACGFTLKRGNLQPLEDGIHNKINRMYQDNPHIFDVNKAYDMELHISDITLDLYDGIMSMEPFGQGNPLPLFKIPNVNLTDIRLLGNEGKHVKFFAIEGNYRLECILFNEAASYMELITCGDSVDLIGTIDVNEWNGRKTIQFKTEDIIKHGGKQK